MAYTIPPSVDTQEQAILAVASAVKGEQVTGGDGSVNTALDILADALAGENVQVPMTQQGAILALAQYVSGTAGTPTATKGTVSNHAVNVTPSVTNTSGYITGGTLTGTAVTVSASELVSGSQTVTTNDTYDVTNLAELVVNVSGGGVDVGALALVGLIDDAPTVGGSIFISGAISRVRIGDAAIYGGSSAQGRFAAGLALTTDDIPSDFADTMSAYVCTADESNKFATVEPWDGTLTRGDSEQGFPAYNWTFTMPELQEGEMLILYSHLAS